MVTNELFRQCLSAIPMEQRAEFDLSYGIAERLDAILKKKGITQHELACRWRNRGQVPVSSRTRNGYQSPCSAGLLEGAEKPPEEGG